MELSKLANRFAQQREFSRTYSPLYACLFGTVADWLAQAEDRPLIEWLLAASQNRNSFDIPLLLLAGLHRDVLQGVEALQPLSQYYPTAGGRLPCDGAQFRQDFHQALMARRQSLAKFIRSAAVQTNETGRGLAWLWPLAVSHWEAIHLVDLGASAGLNLVADQRAYRLVEDGEDGEGRILTDLGRGQPVQFLVRCQGVADRLALLNASLPTIASRIGCDLAPFQLSSAEDETMLAAFVWGDQPQRLLRLREGISALHQVNRGSVPVRLYPVSLPHGLSQFLNEKVPANPPWPVVIYNTYMTAYLANKGAALRDHIGSWAERLSQPVLWLQWEPDWQGREAPEYGWCTWTADLWWDGNHRQWHLAWVHPHGSQVKWADGLPAWLDFWQRQYASTRQ